MKGLVAALLVASVALGGAGEAAAKKPAVKCHWVKATKKRKRHKVCVKVKKKAAPAKAPAPVASSAPAAPAAAPAPAAPTTPAAGTIPAVNQDAPPLPGAPQPGDPPSLTRLQATTREFSITLSRPQVAAGPISVQLVNAGEDAHDLHVRTAAGTDVLSVAETQAGGLASVSGTLTAGTYTLYCSLPGHEQAGMRATLTVN